MGWFSSDVETVDAELKEGFNMHLRQTKGQIKRLDRAFEALEEKPKGTQCPAIDGIIDEVNEIAGEVDDKMVLDAALIAAAQAVEHYGMTRCGTLVAWAKLLGHASVAKLPAANLKEEKATDKKLTGITVRKINRKAPAAQKKRNAERPSRAEPAESAMLVAASSIPAI